MTAQYYPELEGPHWPETRDAIHAYSKIPGAYCKALSPKQKHWWHVALQPNLLALLRAVLVAGRQLMQ